MNEILTVARVYRSMLEIVGVLERLKDVQRLFLRQRNGIGQAGICLGEPIPLTATDGLSCREDCLSTAKHFPTRHYKHNQTVLRFGCASRIEALSCRIRC